MTLSFGDYRASEGGTLSFALAGAVALAVNGAANGDDWEVTLSAEQTATLTAGAYQYRIRHTLDGVVKTLETGSIVVDADVTQLNSATALSWEERTLPIVEAQIAGTLEEGLKMYMIQGRQVQNLTLAELKQTRNELLTAIAMQRGYGFGVPVLHSYRSLT